MSTVIDNVDYGPLAQLIGKWSGNVGLDIAPDADANPDESPFTNVITFTVAGAADNAEEQKLVAVKYHHVVRRADNGHIFHDQIGHWIYEPSSQVIMHSLTIPRGVCLLAGGTFKQTNDESIFDVKATAGSDSYGIVQSPFMLEKAKTNAFHMKMTVTRDELSYREVTSLHIYGKDFEHIDTSTLQRITYNQD